MQQQIAIYILSAYDDDAYGDIGEPKKELVEVQFPMFRKLVEAGEYETTLEKIVSEKKSIRIKYKTERGQLTEVQMRIGEPCWAAHSRDYIVGEGTFSCTEHEWKVLVSKSRRAFIEEAYLS